MLFEELEKRGVSLYQFAKDTHIPYDRAKNWRKKNASPKGDDIEKIQNWLGVKVEVSSIVEEEPGVYGHVPASKYIEMLEHVNKTLSDSIQVSLTKIEGRQINLSELTEKVAAMIQVSLDEGAEIRATVQKRSPEEVKEEVNKKLQFGLKVGK